MPSDRGSHDEGGFEVHLEGVLAPTLRAGQVVVMDNLSAHKGDRVKQPMEERGCEPLYLPPYSPDLNSIEQAVSKVTELLRGAEACTRESLIEAVGAAFSAVSTRDARGPSGIAATAPRPKLP